MTTPTILHIDMDAFFASVEQLDNPSLRGLCVVVGGPSQRGVVAAASYEARKYGIRSAMPIFEARQRCRDLVIVPPRRERYTALSRRIMEILNTYSPNVEQVSIDEAYMDATGCDRLYGSPRRMAEAIKNRIRMETCLTCSVGVAPNKFLAKIASDMNKPDGLTVIAPAQMAAFIQSLPIGKIPGVGARAEKKLHAMGIRTLGEVGRQPQERILRQLGKFGHRLMDLAQGRDDSQVTPHNDPKSMSSEITLSADTMDRGLLAPHLLAQSQTVASQLRRHNVLARTITLKIRTADFQRHTRSRTLAAPLRSSDMIFKAVMELLAEFPMTQPVRLVGVGAGGLQPDARPVQQSLFADPADTHRRKWESVDQAMDAVARRYGHSYVKRGSLEASKGDVSKSTDK